MMQFRRVKKRPEQAHCINPQRGSSSNSGLIRIQICLKKYMAPAAQISVSTKNCCPIPQSESQALKRTVLSSAAHSQEGVSVQASCFSSFLRRATQTAEAHLKPEPKESCHTRSPLRTFWNVSTYDHAYLAAANASVFKFTVIRQHTQSLVGSRGTDPSTLLGRSAARTNASLEHFSGQGLSGPHGKEGGTQSTGKDSAALLQKLLSAWHVRKGSQISCYHTIDGAPRASHACACLSVLPAAIYCVES